MNLKVFPLIILISLCGLFVWLNFTGFLSLIGLLLFIIVFPSLLKLEIDFFIDVEKPEGFKQSFFYVLSFSIFVVVFSLGTNIVYNLVTSSQITLESSFLIGTVCSIFVMGFRFFKIISRWTHFDFFKKMESLFEDFIYNSTVFMPFFMMLGWGSDMVSTLVYFVPMILLYAIVMVCIELLLPLKFGKDSTQKSPKKSPVCSSFKKFINKYYKKLVCFLEKHQSKIPSFIYISIVVIFLLLVKDFVITAIPTLFDVILNIFYKNFGISASLNSIVWGFIIFILILIFSAFLELINLLYEENQFKRWFFWTLAIMVGFILWGVIVIDSYTGAPEFFFLLRDPDNNMNDFASITCNNSNNYIIPGRLVGCYISKELTNQTVQINFSLTNGTDIPLIFDNPNNVIVFEIPHNVSFVDIDVKGFYEENISKHLISSGFYEFISPHEYIELKDNFVFYFLGLLGAVLFSVPISMHTLKKIYENKD